MMNKRSVGYCVVAQRVALCMCVCVVWCLSINVTVCSFALCVLAGGFLRREWSGQQRTQQHKQWEGLGVSSALRSGLLSQPREGAYIPLPYRSMRMMSLIWLFVWLMNRSGRRNRFVIRSSRCGSVRRRNRTVYASIARPTTTTCRPSSSRLPSCCTN